MSIGLASVDRGPEKKSLGWFLRQQATAWLSFHGEMLHGIAHRMLIRSKGDTFSKLYNARAWVKGADVRTRYDADAQRTTVASDRYSVEVYPQQRATNYAKGVPQRAERLGADYLLPLLSFAKDDVVIDCGANVGDFKLYFRHHDFDVEYIGIEPGPAEFAVMERNVAPSKAYNVGLWDEDGELSFYVSSKGADSSLIEPPAYDEIVSVPTRRLDGMIDHPRIKLLKVEAEGAEPEVLRGAQNILERIEYITADLGAERGLEQSSTLAPVTNFLLRNGFELVAVNHQRVVALFRNTRLM